jgi:hypothetical protein
VEEGYGSASCERGRRGQRERRKEINKKKTKEKNLKQYFNFIRKVKEKLLCSVFV